jgi:hypothetical protein
MLVFVIEGPDAKGGSKLALRGELHISSEAIAVAVKLIFCFFFIISAASFE